MPRKEKKFHFIYKTTNLLNDKYYIGMHSTDNLDDGYLGSGKRLRYSINKHGAENHEREILEFVNSRKELKDREKEIVNEQLLEEGLCMNLTTGGEGGFSSEQQKLNAEKSNARQKILRETDPEWFEKRNKNISKGNKKAYEEGRREKVYFYDWTDKKHTNETKKKIGEKNSEHQKGRGNSQYGTCWITRNGENKKIKKEELETFIQQGWEKGRKLK